MPREATLGVQTIAEETKKAKLKEHGLPAASRRRHNNGAAGVVTGLKHLVLDAVEVIKLEEAAESVRQHRCRYDAILRVPPSFRRRCHGGHDEAEK